MRSNIMKQIKEIIHFSDADSKYAWRGYDFGILNKRDKKTALVIES